MLGKSDLDQLEYAIKQKRVLLTHNIGDFVQLSQEFARDEKPHFGILVSDQLPLKGFASKVVIKWIPNRIIWE